MDQFKDGYRIIMLINRDKESESRTKDRSSMRYISKDVESFNWIIERFRKIKEDDQRIYVTVNSRDFNKAIRLFKKRQLDNDYASEEERFNFYRDIPNRFISCLQNPETRMTRNFLIDFDSNDRVYFNLTYHRLESLTKILKVQETPKGCHIVTEPFNSSLFSQSSKCTLIKDGMLFIE